MDGEASAVCSGSRLCENADTEINRATIDSARWGTRIIVAVKANFLIQYVVPVSRKSFLHSLGQVQTFGDTVLKVRSLA